MNSIYLTPYETIENNDYQIDTKIVIRASDFNNIPLQEDGRFTSSFINCRFKNLEIENTETIDFKEVSIQFIGCFISEINIKNFTATNFSIFFYSSILKGSITNGKLLNVIVNNCFLNGAFLLFELNSIVISYTENNIFPLKWNKLFKLNNTSFRDILKNNLYYLYNCKYIVFNFNEESTSQKKGFYKRPYSSEIDDKLGYYFTEEEKKEFQISLSIQYSAGIEHKLTKIINAKLSALSISGYSTGELLIENSQIDNWYLKSFSTQIGANFFNIKPFRMNLEKRNLEIHKSNLDKVWFDNVSFNDYSKIAFYRNKFGQTNITSCEFPDDYKGFDKFETIENIHRPDIRDSNYFKIRYETFLQLKKPLEESGNFYEAQKLQSVSNEALKNIEKLQFWDKFILQINSYSNNHGLSIEKPFIWTLIVSVVFYILYLWSLGRMFNCTEIDFNLIGYYFSFLDITHRSDFLVDDKTELNGFSVTIDSLNKILLSFLIYQFIAAFRKYGKK